MSSMSRISALVLVTCVAWLSPVFATQALAASTVTFEELAPMPGAGGSPITSDQYIFANGAQAVLDSPVTLLGAPFQSGNNHYLVFAATPGNSLSFARADNSAFALLGLDLAGWYQSGTAPWSVTVTGIRADASSVLSTFTVAFNSFSSFASTAFAGFSNLTSVSITGTQQPGGYYLALDNVVTTPVPEPSTYALMLSGLLLLLLSPIVRTGYWAHGPKTRQ